MTDPSQWPFKGGQPVVMSRDWHYTHDRYEATITGKEGTEFLVDTYIPAEMSDAGFAFIHGISHSGEHVICPAEFCQAIETGDS